MAFNITITEKGGKPRVESFEQGEVTIGRVSGNDIVLAKGNISKRHSRIVLRDDKFVIVDLKSTNGTYVNGKRITGPQVLRELDKVYIGDYILTLDSGNGVRPNDEEELFRPNENNVDPIEAELDASLNALKVNEPAPQIDDDLLLAPVAPQTPPPRPERVEKAPPRRPTVEPAVEPVAARFEPPARAVEPPPPPPPRFEPPARAIEPTPPLPPPPRFEPPARVVEPPPPPPPRFEPPARVVEPTPPPPPPRFEPPARVVEPTPPPVRPEPPKPPKTRPVESAPPPPVVVTPPVTPVAPVAPVVPVVPVAPVAPVVSTPPVLQTAQMTAAQPVEQSVAHARNALFLSILPSIQALAEHSVDGELPQTHVYDVVEKAIHAAGRKLGQTNGLVEQMTSELCGWGALGGILADTSWTELFFNGPHQVLARAGGVLAPMQATFSCAEAMSHVAARLLAGSGVVFDAQNPLAEGRLGDGTRLHAVHHSVSLHGPHFTLSRPSYATAHLHDLVEQNVLSAAMAEFLTVCIQMRRNVLIASGAGANGDTLLGALVALLPENERLVAVQQVATLRPTQPHSVVLEPINHNGKSTTANMRSLVSSALRMRPGRLVIHELMGAEAMDLLSAMSGGLVGVLATLSADGVRSSLDRVEALMTLANYDVPSRALREQIANAVDVVVVVNRFADGHVRVTQVAEILGTEVDLITTQDIFAFKREGFGEDGALAGRFYSTGVAPRFYEDLARRGEPVNMALFRDS